MSTHKPHPVPGGSAGDAITLFDCAPHPEAECYQCADYAPIVRALRLLEVPASIDENTGGNVHVIEVELVPRKPGEYRASRYLFANREGAGIYDDALFPDDMDCEGQAQLVLIPGELQRLGGGETPGPRSILHTPTESVVDCRGRFDGEDFTPHGVTAYAEAIRDFIRNYNPEAHT